MPPLLNIRDPVATAPLHSLQPVMSMTATDTSDTAETAAASGPRIKKFHVSFAEVESCFAMLQNPSKTKLISISESNAGKNGKTVTAANQRKNNGKSTGPSLPKPTVTIFDAEKVNLGWQGAFPIGAGMYNLGNSCYLNSTLQALFHVPALVNWLLSDDHHTSKCEQNDDGGECLTCAMAKTLQFSHEKSGCAIKPFYIYNKLKLICKTMSAGQQEDAHEFLRCLLQGMERVYLARHSATELDSYSKETTPLNQIFGGYIRTEVKCMQCRHVSTTFQHFQDLLVDIGKASTLDEALTSYFSHEQLGNNDYKCEACKRRVSATKHFSLERPPKVLCVQLNRFDIYGDKISRHIGFKQTVDMGPYLRRQPNEPVRQLNYKLMSIVTHTGSRASSGHYTTVAQVSNGQYYSFDDSSVQPVNIGNVLNTNAYIMIFEMESNTQNNKFGCQTSKVNDLSLGKLPTSNSTIMETSSKASTTESSGESTNGIVKKTNDKPRILTFASILAAKSANSTENSTSKITSSTGPQVDEDDTFSTNAKQTSGGSMKNGAGGTQNGVAKLVRKSKESDVKLVKNVGVAGSANSKTEHGAVVTGNETNGSNGKNKHQNGKTENCGRNGEQNEEDTWHMIRARKKSRGQHKIMTKASSSNGCQFAKAEPLPSYGN